MPMPMRHKLPPIDPGQPLDASEIPAVTNMALEPEHRFGFHLGSGLDTLLRIAAGDLTEREMLHRLRDALDHCRQLEGLLVEHLRSIENDAQRPFSEERLKSALGGLKVDSHESDLDGD